MENTSPVDMEEGKIVNNNQSNAEVGSNQAQREMVSAALQNPEFVSAIQGRLDNIVGQPTGYFDSLPPKVKRRVKALKKIQYEVIKLESKLTVEMHQLESKYNTLYSPHFDHMKSIIVGDVEPTDSDCDWPSESEDDVEVKVKEEKLASDVTEKVKLEDEKPGIPSYWATIFANAPMLAECIQAYDEPILEYLTDVRCVLFVDPPAFTLEFYFSANPYFTNSVLTKWYKLNATPDEEDKLDYDGMSIVKAKGCNINWNSGKNVTVKSVKKKQKNKKGSTRTINKTVEQPSFFNFFSPPEFDENDELDSEDEDKMEGDFAMGQLLREDVLPRSVLYFTGEIEADDDEDDEEVTDNDDDDSDEEADPDFKPPADSQKQTPGECKQQ